MEIIKTIEKAKLGDQVAFTFLLDFYWNDVYGFMLKRTENETDAEDITIETFSKAFDKLASYNSEFQFNTWLIAIAKNVHIDILRKKKASFFIEISDNDDYRAYIKELKPHYQEVIQLRYFQELSYQEIANQLNEPLSNVKVKILRSKKLLAEIIQTRG